MQYNDLLLLFISSSLFLRTEFSFIAGECQVLPSETACHWQILSAEDSWLMVRFRLIHFKLIMSQMLKKEAEGVIRAKEKWMVLVKDTKKQEKEKI